MLIPVLLFIGGEVRFVLNLFLYKQIAVFVKYDSTHALRAYVNNKNVAHSLTPL